MQVEAPADRRELRTDSISCALAVAGGGLAGACCAIAAARAGLKVVLTQDRPVLGGNASSEVRLWVLGATSHMGNNNRWAREGGVIDELLVENMHRNPEGNPLLFDALLLEKVAAEPNIRLLLNTAVCDLAKRGDRIERLIAFCPQNSTRYEIAAPLFCDASGDGIVGFLAGAAFRMGAEAREEFGEKFAPDKAYGELLGHSLYFYSKDTGRPVQYVPPAFALADITAIPRYRQFKLGDYGCRLWWLEYGGRLDTVHDTEQIKWELWKVAYGVWHYIKNSGQFPEAATHTLEWVGTIPGKRESRRFEGDHMLIQQDVVEQRPHDDAISFGGWAIDLHPADGVYSPQPGCSQWHAKGVYAIPYRTMYSRNVANLFLAGRVISASHVAFGSSRVMATCAHGGQAVGLAAALCRRLGLLPRDVAAQPHIGQLQQDLLRTGHYIPGVTLNDPADLARQATITASSRTQLAELKPSGETMTISDSWAMMLPLAPGAMPRTTLMLAADADTELCVELRMSSRPENHTPDVTLERKSLRLSAGGPRPVALTFASRVDLPRYGFVCLMANPLVRAQLSQQRLTGVLAVTHRANLAVAKSATQQPEHDIGVDTFEFWTPLRRPHGQNLAIAIDPPIDCFGPENVTNGVARPVAQPNAWVADGGDPRPTLTLRWPMPQTIGRIELSFDTDWDHPMESVLMGHPENVMPFCVQEFRLFDGASGRLLAECRDNHQTRRTIPLETPLQTDHLRLELAHPSANVPAALFEIRCYPS